MIRREQIETYRDDYEWVALLDDYDGAPDSPTRNHHGSGRTEQEAIDDLLEFLDEELA